VLSIAPPLPIEPELLERCLEILAAELA
jgi:hypothetical protein